MLFQPFRRLPRQLLRLLLMVLVVIELLLALSLYKTSQPVAGAIRPTATATQARHTTTAHGTTRPVASATRQATTQPSASRPAATTAPSREGTPRQGTQGPNSRRIPGPLSIVQNTPRTVVAGNQEEFSVKLPALAHTLVTYTLTYPHETTIMKVMKTDATGYSKVIFHINHVPATYREPVVISVYYKGVKEATTRFAVQQPSKTGSQ